MAENFLQSLMSGYQLGSQIKQDRTQSKLAQLASQAYGAAPEQRQSILAQAVGVDPAAGMALGDKLQGVDDQRAKTMVQGARYLLSLPDEARPAAYQQLRGGLTQFGVQLPEQYDGSVAQAAQALVDAYSPQSQSPAGFEEFRRTANAAGLHPGDPEYQRAARLALYLERRPSNAALQYKEVVGSDGRTRYVALDPNEVGAETIGGGYAYGAPVGASKQPAPAPGYQQSSPAMFVAQDGQPIPQQDQAALVAAMRAAERGENVNIPASGYTPSDPASTTQRALPSAGLPARLDYRNGGTVNPFESRSPEEQAARTEQAKTQVQLANLPAELKLRRDSALEQAQGTADISAQSSITEDARQKTNALAQYETAMSGLQSGLAGTETGPIVGRLPALTANQQIAEGGVAAIAPVLKQLFRSAGEGVFTDKDQELLMQMVPTRTDHPEARQAKIANIDAIVRAKLSASSAAPSASVQRARNPATGEVIELRNGQWEPVR